MKKGFGKHHKSSSPLFLSKSQLKKHIPWRVKLSLESSQRRASDFWPSVKITSHVRKQVLTEY